MDKPKLKIKSNLTQWEKVIKLAKEKPNDMELGKAIRTLINDYNNGKIDPPFTWDYTQ